MPNRTTDNLFSPHGTISSEQAERYVRGELTPSEQHEMELHLEGDPLLRDAVDGMRLPGVLAAMQNMRGQRPGGELSAGKAWLIAGLSIAVVAITFWYFDRTAENHPVLPADNLVETVMVPTTPAEQVAFAEELTQAIALPESLRSAFRGSDRFAQTANAEIPVSREDPPAQVEAIPVAPVPTPLIKSEKPHPTSASLPSRKLMFFFDLKLVHPQELYHVDPLLELADGSVDARFSDARAKVQAGTMDHPVPYDRFFNTAMGKFSRGDRQGCLEDMFLVLEEYPDDVNALFYAGLCCYDLGLFPRAVRLLDRARHHSIETFAEEAQWYHALAVERANGHEQALALLNAVVERNGFYAARARAHLVGK